MWELKLLSWWNLKLYRFETKTYVVLKIKMMSCWNLNFGLGRLGDWGRGGKGVKGDGRGVLSFLLLSLEWEREFSIQKADTAGNNQTGNKIVLQRNSIMFKFCLLAKNQKCKCKFSYHKNVFNLKIYFMICRRCFIIYYGL